MIWTWFKTNWKDVSLVLLAVLLIARFLKDVFELPFFGKKLYKGAPLLWKWIMRSTIHRKEMQDDIGAIKKELMTNGGTSLKDAVRRIEVTQQTELNIIKELISKMNFNSLRLELYDQRSKLMSFKLDGRGACIFVSDSFLKRFGISEADVMEFGYENLMHDEDRERVAQKWQRAIEKCSRFIDEHRIRKNDGDYVLCLVRGYPITEIIANGQEHERCVGFYGTVDEVD